MAALTAFNETLVDGLGEGLELVDDEFAVRHGTRWLPPPAGPRERDDAAYFVPLNSLRLPPRTQLYLGLIHHADEAGDRRRIAIARTVTPRFGVATECGWGRTDPARVSGLLESHRRAVEYLASAG